MTSLPQLCLGWAGWQVEDQLEGLSWQCGSPHQLSALQSVAIEIGTSAFFGGGNGLELFTSSGSRSGLLLISVSGELGLTIKIGASTFFGGGNGLELCTSSRIRSCDVPKLRGPVDQPSIYEITTLGHCIPKP